MAWVVRNMNAPMRELSADAEIVSGLYGDVGVPEDDAKPYCRMTQRGDNLESFAVTTAQGKP